MSEQLYWLCIHGLPTAHYYRRGIGLVDSFQIGDLRCAGGHPVETEKVWWCGNHQASGNFEGCFVAQFCRMVERFLIPLSNGEE